MAMLRQTVLDTLDPRRAAEFWRQFLGWAYRPGDEPPPAGQPDPNGRGLAGAAQSGRRHRCSGSSGSTSWPGRPGRGPVPQQLHLDLTVPDIAALDAEHERVLGLGATLLDDSRQRDPQEPLRVYGDPDGHPFCIFVG